MLNWTRAGAVEGPRTLQIRLQRSYPGRVRAGAPVPTRSMSTEEVRANIGYFTDTRPRGVPVTALVLSGVGAASRPDLPELVAFARDRGVQTVVLHAGVEDLAGLDPAALPVDRLVLPLQPGDAGAALAEAADALGRAARAGRAVAVHTVLSPSAIPLLPAISRVAAMSQARSFTLTFPFPVDGAPASEVDPAPRAVAALNEVIPALEARGLSVAIKGLPVCYLGSLARLVYRTANRWYADADHQLAKALLFFPDVVAFHKEDDCRFCPADSRCDGFFATYLRRPGFPRLIPLGA